MTRSGRATIKCVLRTNPDARGRPTRAPVPGGGFPFDIGGLGGFDFGLGRGKENSGGFSDFFETIFGRMQQAGEQQGKDLEQEIEVTLAEAYAGTNRSFNLQVPGQCPACAGSGRIENMVCTVCRGSGTQMRQRRLDVKIPAGVREGSRIRVAGEGHPGRNGERGNLYLDCEDCT